MSFAVDMDNFNNNPDFVIQKNTIVTPLTQFKEGLDGAKKLQ